ncbi:RNA polymerase sigma factor [Flavobacterium sp. N502536]|uniref:RNA polymerase sigma factor n=1 Tax=Flavobacterium sp. N502536 TaxID=2986837 RepID=UPI0022235EDF|nr:sigma-70 family RNA polymerase sigma factor [Flavobacterium sp. N502536]
MSRNYNNDRFIPGIKEGSEEAFRMLFDSFHLKIYTVSKRMGMTNEEAEDVIQECFLQLWKQRDSIKEDLSINGLLYTIAKRIILKKIKENKHYYKSKDLEAYSLPTDNKTQDDISFLETNKFIEETIENLPNQQRITFLMNYKKGMTPEEICKELELSKRTVENQIFRAKKKIKNVLIKLGLLF